MSSDREFDPEEKAAAQLIEDYRATLREMGVGESHELYRVFCAGVAMGLLTAEDMAKNPEKQFVHGSVDNSIGVYCSVASQRAFGAN